MGADPDDWRRAPGHGKYARAEVERRFLVRGKGDARDQGRLIEDRYLDGLRLRLRRVTKNGQSVFKLTQKVRVEDSDPTALSITNIYLSMDEYERLMVLPGCDLVKTRRVVPAGSTVFVVDEFGGPLQGLVLAEVELASLQDPLDTPRWIGQEITSDDRFTGGQLARANAREISELLRSAATDIA